MEKSDRTEYHRQYYLKRKELKKRKTEKARQTDPEKAEKRPPLEKLESRENELIEWLLENSFFHPDYDSKRRELNFVQTSIELKKGNRMIASNKIETF